MQPEESAPEMMAREMLYSKNPVGGAIFTSPPWKVFLFASAVGCCQILAAIAVRLHSIPTAQGNRGFLYSYHWSLMFPLIIPLILAMAAAISEGMRSCIIKLEKNGRIVKREPATTVSYAQALSKELSAWARPLLIGALAIALVMVLADTYNLWIGFVPGHSFPASRKPEWDTAFNVANWGATYESPAFREYLQMPPSKTGNLLFDIASYLSLIAAYGLGLFWFGKFTLYLLAVSRLIGGQHPTHLFCPLINDLDLRMGLKPMSRIFNNFLAITILVEAWAFYHRLHLIKLANNQPFHAYITTTLQRIVFPPESPTIPYPLTHFTELFNRSSWALNGIDVSAITTLLFMTLPIIAVCIFPLWRIRKFVGQRRDEELGRLQKEYEEALEAKEYDRVQLVEHEKTCLEKTNIWPNGNARAKRYLTIIFALAAGALAPPLLAIILAVRLSNTLSNYVRLVFQRGVADG